MNKFRIFIAVIVAALFLTSCGDTNEPITNSRRTVLVYLIATNSLGSYNCDTKDIAEMDAAISSIDANGCRLLVYWVSKSDKPKLIEIVKSGADAKHNVLKQYSSDIKSTTTRRMKEVINDVIAIAPADDYGLILWSHASGWAKSLTMTKVHGSSIQLMDFGEDSGNTMPIDSLSSSLPDGMFNFVYTDACYMGAVEIAYELRNKTKYFIGSATELPIDGMPYDKNIPCFFATTPQLETSCQNTFNDYNSRTGTNRSCTIALVDCGYLSDLKDICKSIISSGESLDDASSIQRYKDSAPYLFYDFGQYMTELANENQKQQLESALSNAVIYKAATPQIFGTLTINPQHYSGLSTYILGTAGSTNESYYKTLQWYKDVYL